MSSAYYFASRGHGSTTEFNAIPQGAQISEFYARPVQGYSRVHTNSNGDNAHDNHSNSKHNNNDDDDDHSYSIGEQKVAPQIPSLDPPVGSLLLPRKVPTKVFPNAMFAVERTFIDWLHSSIWLLGASLTIITYSQGDPVKFIYGSILMPVALSFTFYSVYQFRRRVVMLKTKHPGPYEDVKGPTVLTIMLMTSIMAQFAIKLIYWS